MPLRHVLFMRSTHTHGAEGNEPCLERKAKPLFLRKVLIYWYSFSSLKSTTMCTFSVILILPLIFIKCFLTTITTYYSEFIVIIDYNYTIKWQNVQAYNGVFFNCKCLLRPPPSPILATRYSLIKDIVGGAEERRGEGRKARAGRF